ncbi:secretion protein HlyD [Alcanivorax hongdengensis A-11-3]|uniref:Secretion protein HlyD n=1 Tax=Alcanivorax hongdengensis A-11-3 TaxID=1177179 RepID=L0WCX0_9GAMM|nr:secretion protein HlyD [Alcanivorax hongdengensis A-11-3]
MLLAALLVLALLVWIGQWFYYQHTHVSADDARVMTHEITVSSRQAGRVDGFTLTEGDSLQASQLVASLYSRPDQLKLKELQARVAQARARVALEEQQVRLAGQQLDGGIRETRDQLKTDQAALEAARAAMDKAAKTYKRSNDLFQSGTVSAQKKEEDYYTWQETRAQFQRARQQVNLDRSSLDNAHTGMLSGAKMTLQNPDLLKAQLAVTRQNLAEAQLALQHQQVEVEDRQVASPKAGVVDRTFVEQGEYVSAGQPLLMMHAPEDVWVEANVKETRVRKLRPGQPVDIRVDAYPDRRFHGHVQVIGHAATSEFALLPNPNPSGNFTKITQRIPVRIAIDKGARHLLSPGMMVVVDIDTREQGDSTVARR